MLRLSQFQNLTRDQIEALSPRSRSAIFEPPIGATSDQPPMSKLSSTKDVTIFGGGKQPDPKLRLAQARIFLADEDYYRNLNFIQKLADIEAYVKFLEKNKYKGEEKQIKEVKEMIRVHKCWIRDATITPSLNMQFAKFDHQNRLVDRIKDSKKRGAIARMHAHLALDRLSGRLDPGPAIHMTLDDLNERNGGQKRASSPDPFFYTKKVTEFRRIQDTIEAARGEAGTGNATRLIALAAPLSPGQSISVDEASRLLRKQIIVENHRYWEGKRPNLPELWGFGVGIKKPRNFFSLDRWPIELQTLEKASEIIKSGPKRPSPKEIWERRASMPQGRKTEVIKDPRETYIHGIPYFPFGETPFQEAALSWEIEQDLASVPEYSRLYRINKRGQKVLIVPEEDPFALPDISRDRTDSPQGIISQFMSVFGKRKRDAAANETNGPDGVHEVPRGATGLPRAIRSRSTSRKNSYPEQVEKLGSNLR